MIDALKALRAGGAKQVVCTNKPTDLSLSLLTKLGMAGPFDGVVGIDAVTAAKPNAAHLIEAVKAVGGDLARSPPTFQQRVIADFLPEVYFPAHLRRLRERLRASRDMLGGS
ncbi:HAD family hydrolase [Rhizobium tibeticum]|uniref:HAD family hydrolase n=1 Tax=Rhizobium tibeticum TaxID=501024 RepID=UPI003521909B